LLTAAKLPKNAVSISLLPSRSSVVMALFFLGTLKKIPPKVRAFGGI
jgi:hypothetical protein